MTSQDFAQLELPDGPGVYFFKGPKNADTKASAGSAPILYIGRATSLRDRVKSYFASDLIETRGQLLVDMVAHAETIEWQETDSVLEAIILENNLIKANWPVYNTKDKDDRSYNYVVITDEDFPQVMLVRGKLFENKNNNIDSISKSKSIKKGDLKIKKKFGPYPQAGLLREALGIVRKIFPFRYARIGKPLNPQHEAFYRSIELSPDISMPDAKKEYAKTIRNLTLFFQGRKSDLIKALEKDMRAYARARQFEKAAAVKKTLYALQHIQDVALIKQNYKNKNCGAQNTNIGNNTSAAQNKNTALRIEAYDIAHLSGKEVVGVMVVIDVYQDSSHEADKSQYRKFKLSKNINDDTGNLREILVRRLTHSEWPRPDLIVIDGGQGQLHAARQILAEDPQYKDIPVVSVVKDSHHKAREILSLSENVDPTKAGTTYSQAILFANSEAHRFAIAYHRYRRRRATGL